MGFLLPFVAFTSVQIFCPWNKHLCLCRFVFSPIRLWRHLTVLEHFLKKWVMLSLKFRMNLFFILCLHCLLTNSQYVLSRCFVTLHAHFILNCIIYAWMLLSAATLVPLRQNQLYKIWNLSPLSWKWQSRNSGGVMLLNSVELSGK